MRWLASLLGLAGGFLLCVTLAPVLLSSRNSSLITQWRDIVIAWTQFTGYLRLAFAVVATFFIILGLVGVLISFVKPVSGRRFMIWGGIATVVLLGALWIGLLDLQIPLLGSTDIGSHLVWDSNWGIARWAISKKIISLGGGWLKPAMAGGILLLATGLPQWWKQLK